MSDQPVPEKKQEKVTHPQSKDSESKDRPRPEVKEGQQKQAPAQKKSKKTPVIIACSCLVILALLAVCGVVGYFLLTAETDGQSVTVDLETGDLVGEVSATIDQDGGEVAVNDESSSINGTTVFVGEGLVEEDEEVTIGYLPVTDLSIPSHLNLLSDVIVLEKANSELMFTHPVAVIVPYDKTKVQSDGLVGVYEYDPDTGKIDATTVVEHDADAGTVSFMTTHFSYYIVVELLDTFEELLTDGYDSGFVPSEDGWFITNWGSYITDGGNCLGMSAMAKYVYGYQQASLEKSFYENFREGDLNEEYDDVIAQELAARNQLSLTNRWNELSSDIDRYERELGVSLGESASSRKQGEIIMRNLKATGEPQVLYVTQLFTDNTWGAAHAVLTYKYADGFFYIYDPNYPHRSGSPDDAIKKLKFDPETGFGIYDSSTSAGGPGLRFNVIYHLGTSFFTEKRIMAGLWNKALGGFSDDEFPEITFQTPEEGEVITEKSVVVTGSVSGGNYETSADDKYLHWYYQNEKGGLEYIRSKLDENGSFTQELPVVPGENTVHVLAAGKQPTDEWAGFAKVTIDASIKAADMVVTLTWDKGQSDIDLHVTDPDGVHVWYLNMNAPTGAQLDVDNTSGYGPEHYTISSEEGDDMPYGAYKVKVVYYADHDGNYESDQRVPYSVNMRWVKIILPDGTKIWETVTRSGALTSAGQEKNVYTIEHKKPNVDDYEIVANPFDAQ